MKLMPVIGFLLFGVAVSALDTTQKSRRIPFSAAIPISSRLLADDVEVVVAKVVPNRCMISPPKQCVRGYSTKNSTVLLYGVAVVQVESTRGELIQNGTWIDTIVTLRPDEIIRANVPMVDSARMQVRVPNGEVVIQGVNVRAGAFPSFDKVTAL